MKPWAMHWLSVALSVACCGAASAQGVLGSIIPSPTSWFDSRTEYPEAKPFGEDGKQLPGQLITRTTKLKGKWLHRQLRRNVELDRVRVPQSFTSFLLDLQADGSYTVDYQVVWGGAANTPDSLFATLEAHEKGRFALSGSILLLESTAIDVVRTGRNGEQRQSLQNQRRAYVARLDRTYLNIAGPCAPYQAEDLCHRHRNVWFALSPLTAAQLSPQQTSPLPSPFPQASPGTRR